MTKDKLLNTLRKMNINNYNDKILDRDEYILKLLLTLDDSLIKIGIDIIIYMKMIYLLQKQLIY